MPIHMQPSYYEGVYSEITNTSGETWYVPEEVSFAAASDYCEGTPASVTIREGILYHLSAPGYMDQTDWTPADSIEEAQEELSAQYDCCADCGEDLGEREGILCDECAPDESV